MTQGRPGLRVRNVRGKSGPKSLCLCCFLFPDTKDFPSVTRSRMEILVKENLLGAGTAPRIFQDFHSLSKVSLVRTFLFEPGSGSKIGRLGGWVWKNDPEMRGICQKQNLGGHFSPEKKKKKIFSPSPQIPRCAADTLPAPRPLPSWKPHPPWDFQVKLRPPPALRTPQSPFPSRKKNKKY